MTFEQGAIAVIASLAGVVTFLFFKREDERKAELKELKKNSDECQSWRKEWAPKLTEMAVRLGIAERVETLIASCPLEGCPNVTRIPATYSVSADQKPKTKRKNLNL